MEGIYKLLLVFLAVQDSSIGDIVSDAILVIVVIVIIVDAKIKSDLMTDWVSDKVTNWAVLDS